MTYDSVCELQKHVTSDFLQKNYVMYDCVYNRCCCHVLYTVLPLTVFEWWWLCFLIHPNSHDSVVQ